MIRPADARRSASVEQDQLHQIFVGRRADRLDDKTIAAADVLANFDHHFAVGKAANLGFTHLHAEMLGDLARERGVRVPGENFELVLDPVGHFNSPASRSSSESSLAANHRKLGWAGRIRTFECQVQSLVPYQLGDRPAHLDSKAARASPIYIVKIDSRRNAMWALSRRIEQSKIFGPNRRKSRDILPGLEP